MNAIRKRCDISLASSIFTPVPSMHDFQRVRRPSFTDLGIIQSRRIHYLNFDPRSRWESLLPCAFSNREGFWDSCTPEVLNLLLFVSSSGTLKTLNAFIEPCNFCRFFFLVSTSETCFLWISWSFVSSLWAPSSSLHHRHTSKFSLISL